MKELEQGGYLIPETRRLLPKKIFMDHDGDIWLQGCDNNGKVPSDPSLGRIILGPDQIKPLMQALVILFGRDKLMELLQ